MTEMTLYFRSGETVNIDTRSVFAFICDRFREMVAFESVDDYFYTEVNTLDWMRIPECVTAHIVYRDALGVVDEAIEPGSVVRFGGFLEYSTEQYNVHMDIQNAVSIYFEK